MITESDFRTLSAVMRYFRNFDQGTILYRANDAVGPATETVELHPPEGAFGVTTVWRAPRRPGNFTAKIINYSAQIAGDSADGIGTDDGLGLRMRGAASPSSQT
jgi:hypothetical protein